MVTKNRSVGIGERKNPCAVWLLEGERGDRPIHLKWRANFTPILRVSYAFARAVDLKRVSQIKYYIVSRCPSVVVLPY
jgi:hypothetical protein